MRLRVLGSGSSGNCCLLENVTECLVIEAGVKYSEVQKALDYDTGKIVGCVVTHEHGDHAGRVGEFLAASVDIYASRGTWKALNITGHRVQFAETGNTISAGGFNVLPFKVEHDAAEPLGYLIKHSELGVLLFATDTYYIKNRFAGLNHIMLECNYAEDILDENVFNGVVPLSVRNRVISSHMELSMCVDFLLANDLRQVNTIVLMHISERNGNPKRFITTVESNTGIATYAARKGLELYLTDLL